MEFMILRLVEACYYFIVLIHNVFYGKIKNNLVVTKVDFVRKFNKVPSNIPPIT